MTQHLDVERLAREAGFRTLALDLTEGQEPIRLIQPVSSTDISVELRKFRALVLEEAAKNLEAVSRRSRWITAGINSEEIKPCEYASAIRALAEGVR